MIAGRCAAEVAAQVVFAVWNDVSLRATRHLVTWRHLQNHSPVSPRIQPAPKCNGHPSIDWCIVWEGAQPALKVLFFGQRAIGGYPHVSDEFREHTSE
jgi:hypothetical protein